LTVKLMKQPPCLGACRCSQHLKHVSMLPAAAQSIVLPCGRLDDDLSDDDLLGDLAGSSQAVPLARPLAPSALREVVK
jgi:hypothetical protein